MSQHCIDIQNEDFLIDGRITFLGRHFQGHRIEGLLPNSRMIQGIFDDLNPETRPQWQLSDGSAFDADQPENNFLAATAEHASWGFFDYRMGGEPFECGYQSMPCDWGIRSQRKRGFFDRLQTVTSGTD